MDAKWSNVPRNCLTPVFQFLQSIDRETNFFAALQRTWKAFEHAPTAACIMWAAEQQKLLQQTIKLVLVGCECRRGPE